MLDSLTGTLTSKSRQKDVNGTSKGRQRSVNQTSTKRQPDINEASTRHQRHVNEASTERQLEHFVESGETLVLAATNGSYGVVWLAG
jgi:hypothetical protein